MTRTPKTPTQRASEVVAVLERRLARTHARAVELAEEADVLTAECQRIERRLAYAKANPDLPAPANLPPS